MIAPAHDASVAAYKFHGSKLIRSLTELGLLDAVDPADGFAEKLGLWIHFTDAIALSAVHGDSRANTPDRRAGVHFAAHAGAAVAEFERIQALLAASVAKSCSPNPGKTHIRLPAPDFDAPPDSGMAYAPYRRFYEAHQRDMELSIQPLRTNLRAALAKASPRLRKLADLDAALEKILRDRESKLLSMLPVLLKKRFDNLARAHREQTGDARTTDRPAASWQAAGWLARFHNDIQTLLLAELELRLQPALGLIEAFKHDTQ